MLNVTDNHLDRYAGHRRLRARPRRGSSRGGGVQVLNRDDPRSLGDARSRAAPVADLRRRRAGSAEASGASSGVDGATVACARRRAAGPGGRPRAGRAAQRAERAGRAGADVRGRARSTARVLAALTRFRGPAAPDAARRARRAACCYVNDSKGTTVAATRAALEGSSGRSVLIAGGDGKGQDFAPLRPAVDAHCRAVLLIGRDAPLIARGARGHAGAPSTTAARSTRRSTRARRSSPRPGDAVLLSPACASLDLFANYVERGERFAAAVRAHAAEARPCVGRSPPPRRCAALGIAEGARRSIGAAPAAAAHDARLRRVARLVGAAAARDRAGHGLLGVDRDGRGVDAHRLSRLVFPRCGTRCSSPSAWSPRLVAFQMPMRGWQRLAAVAVRRRHRAARPGADSGHRQVASTAARRWLSLVRRQPAAFRVHEARGRAVRRRATRCARRRSCTRDSRCARRSSRASCRCSW